jgi:serine/threonine protein kinase
MRDIKPENILLHKDLSVSLCDFGWATKMDNVQYRMKQAGTPAYMSPECLKGELQHFATDLWSLGVLLYELHHNREPFSSSSSCDQQLFYIENESLLFKPNIDPNVKELIEGLLKINCNERFTMKDIIFSSYFRQYATQAQIIELTRTERGRISTSLIRLNKIDSKIKKALKTPHKRTFTLDKWDNKKSNKSYLNTDNLMTKQVSSKKRMIHLSEYKITRASKFAKNKNTKKIIPPQINLKNPGNDQMEIGEMSTQPPTEQDSDNGRVSLNDSMSILVTNYSIEKVFQKNDTKKIIRLEDYFKD